MMGDGCTSSDEQECTIDISGFEVGMLQKQNFPINVFDDQSSINLLPPLQLKRQEVEFEIPLLADAVIENSELVEIHVATNENGSFS